MAITPFPGIRSFATHHCITGSMRRIYEFNQCPISEEMLLGLGSGVGFVYWHMKGTTPFLGGRANTGRTGEEGMEQAAARCTGVKLEVFTTPNSKKAERALLEKLESSQPVMLQVDMGFLPYFNFPEEYHFGGHAVVACGYDSATGQVLVADRELEFYPVTLTDLAKARGSKYKPFEPLNKLYSFDFSGFRQPRSEEIIESIRSTVIGMLEPPITNLGVQGIRKAAKRVLKWPEVMSDDDVRRACFNVYIFIDAAGGTGGGIFRYMYGRFLQEASELTSENRLAGVGERMREIGDRWQEVAVIFKEAAAITHPLSLLKETTQPMLQIADCEQQAWEALRGLV